jgi:prolyl oligopeptidase family protein
LVAQRFSAAKKSLAGLKPCATLLSIGRREEECRDEDAQAGGGADPGGWYRKKPFWEDPSDWLSHSSLMSVGKVTVPTLLMTGVLDRRTPMPQTEDYYSALKMRGVPVKRLQFNEEYLGTGSKPSNYIRTQLYIMSLSTLRSASRRRLSSTAVRSTAGGSAEACRFGRE